MTAPLILAWYLIFNFTLLFCVKQIPFTKKYALKFDSLYFIVNVKMISGYKLEGK
jgi:hypothetical protein